MSKMEHESDTVKENYQVLIAEYHHSLCIIKDYFKQANRKLILKLIDDTTCKLLRTTTSKDAVDKEKCLDPRVSTENLMTGHRVLHRLAALPNFKDIEGADREEVCEIFDSLQTAHAAIADVASSLASLGHRLHPHQFQFLLKHSISSSSISVILVNSDLKSNIYPTMNFTNNAVSTPYCQDPTIHL